MATVTIPGTGGSAITVPVNGTFVQLVAKQIANAMAASLSPSNITIDR